VEIVEDRRTRKRAETRDEILAAAWELAERDGIAGLSLRDLAATVGMRAPSLYTYFDSKGAIYDAMFRAGWQALDADFDTIGTDGPALDVLTDGIEHFLTFCSASLARYQIMFTRVVADWEPSPEAYAYSVANYERLRDFLRKVGIVDAAALDLWTALSAGLAAQQIANDPGGDRWQRLARPAAEMYLAQVRRMQ
jgi:AcrR family transcriptional regulator